jgi:hypothetical protein
MNLRYPERLLQPWKDLRQFTQELYAMVRSGNEDVSGGIDVDTPPVKVGEQSFKVQRKASGELNLVPEAQARHKRDEPSEGPRTFEAPPRRRREPEGRTRREPAIEERLRQASEAPSLPRREERRAREPYETPDRRENIPPKAPEPGRTRKERVAEQAQEEGRRREAPDSAPSFKDRTVETADSPRRHVELTKFELRPQEPGITRTKFPIVNVSPDVDYPTRQVPTGGGGGTTIFAGRVTGKSGSKATVTLYPDGSKGKPGDEVEVDIKDLDSSETLPNGWLFGIFEFTDEDGKTYYEAKPPMWVA